MMAESSALYKFQPLFLLRQLVTRLYDMVSIAMREILVFLFCEVDYVELRTKNS